MDSAVELKGTTSSIVTGARQMGHLRPPACTALIVHSSQKAACPHATRRTVRGASMQAMQLSSSIYDRVLRLVGRDR